MTTEGQGGGRGVCDSVNFFLFFSKALFFYKLCIVCIKGGKERGLLHFFCLQQQLLCHVIFYKTFSPLSLFSTVIVLKIYSFYCFSRTILIRESF